MKNKVLAICLKTYPDEDDMIEYSEGNIKCLGKVKIYYKGKKYKVVPEFVDEKFYKIL